MKKIQLFFASLFIAIMFGHSVYGQDWSSFNPPQVNVVNAAPYHQGSTKYQQLVQQQGFSGIEDWVRHCCLVVAKELYNTPSEANAHGLQTITYKLNDGGSLSYKGGSVPNIEIGFDLNHVVTYSQQYGDEVTKDEIYGILCHEITHGYQKEPRNAGQYDGNSEFFGFIEGSADLVRLITGGFNPPRSPYTGGSWTQGYTTTGFFYLWLTRTKDSQFIKKLNTTAQNYSTWSLNAATQEIFGRTASSLWSDYQAAIPDYPWTGPTTVTADFTASNTSIEVGQSVTFTNRSTNATSYQWTFQGGTPATSTQTNPTVTYNSEGSFTATLEASNGSENSTKSMTITVNSGTGGLADITNLGGEITAQYYDSPTNEDIAKLIDNSANSKYLTFHSSGWVQYYLATPYVVSQYTITSANDFADRDPLNWTLKGSNDGTNWSTIDSRSNQDFPSRYQKRTFTFSNTQAFKYHRLEMTNNSGNILQIAELELFGEEGNAGEPPVASFTTSSTTITVGESVTFTDNSQNANSRSWSFAGGNPASSTQESVSVSYAEAGTFNATLTVSNDYGEDSKTVQITVNAPVLPVASFTTSATNIKSGESITFTDESQNATTRSWSFEGGDPANSTEESVSVRYNTEGTYNATLTVTNDAGEDTKTVQITVNPDNPQVVDITDLGGEITAQYYDSPSNEEIDKLIDNSAYSKYLTFHSAGWVQYYLSTPYIVSEYTLTSANDAAQRDPLNWTLKGSNDGTNWVTVDTRSNQDFPSRYQKRSFTCSNTQAFKYHRLEMTNNSGDILQIAELELFGSESVIEEPPVASFTASATNIEAGESITFTDESQNATSRSWSFEGGNPASSTEESVAVRYNTVGTYNATLTVANDYGEDTKTVQIIVEEPLPVASFTTSSTNITVGESVTFTDNSQNATTRSWVFDGGSPSSSTQETVSVSYNTEGTYDATLTVSNDAGEDTKTVQITVNPDNPQVVDITDLGGEITAQYYDSPSNEEIDKLIDNSANSKYLTFHSSGWVQYYLSTPYIVSEYTLTSANDAAQRDPLNWTLKGSNDGTNWVTVDTRSNQDFPSRYQKRSFTCSNAQAFKYHRLEMTNNSGDILQIAELELFGVEGDITNLPIASFTASATTIIEGESITFTDNSQKANSISWSFEGGNPASSSQPSVTVSYATKGTYNATLTVSNDYGQDSKTVQITVQSSNPDEWDGFIYPEVILSIKAPSHQGVSVYRQLVQQQGYTNIEEWVQHCCLVVAKKLYYTVEEANAHGLRQIRYELTDGGCLSCKGGSPPDIFISFDLNHLMTYYNQYGASIASDEIYGILCHEVTHGYQKEPRNAGEYDGNSEFFGFIEGTADLSRLLTGGFNPERYPSTGGSYKQGYTTTAFFYLWISRTYDNEFLKKLNITAKNYSTWTLTAATQEILGRTASSLWTEYQGQIPAYPWNSQSISGKGTLASSGNSMDNFDENLIAYPNPFRNQLTIKIPGFTTKAKIAIYSVTGVKVYGTEVTSSEFEINTSGLPEGLYFISVDNGLNTRKLRLIKQ